MTIKRFSFLICFILTLSCTEKDKHIGETEIMKWQDGKKAAISITYDDGSINQFREALPIMERLGFPATYYIITGDIPGSEYQPEFIGRPVEEVINETSEIPTNRDNLFERASAMAYLGYRGTREYHTQAGTLYEQDQVDEAIALIDSAFEMVRNGEFEPVVNSNDNDDPGNDQITWEEIRDIAGRGYEFGSHTISHPRLAILDEANMLYELEKSKEEISNRLGFEHTFSAECPYGTEDERVMEYAYKIYPALRNRMPEPFLEELNRGSNMDPGTSGKEYVQWQRGPLTDTPMDLMKSWVDTLLINDNIWLVLVFHGVDGVGWEAKPHEELDTYFNYMKEREDDLWVATFKDVTQYIRERMHASVNAEQQGDTLLVSLSHSIDKRIYHLPLTLKTYVPSGWGNVLVKQTGEPVSVKTQRDNRGTYVIYQAYPNAVPVELAEL